MTSARSIVCCPRSHSPRDARPVWWRHTVKGKGVSFMENDLLWHYRAPDAAELERALAELDAEP